MDARARADVAAACSERPCSMSKRLFPACCARACHNCAARRQSQAPVDKRPPPVRSEAQGTVRRSKRKARSVTRIRGPGVGEPGQRADLAELSRSRLERQWFFLSLSRATPTDALTDGRAPHHRRMHTKFAPARVRETAARLTACRARLCSRRTVASGVRGGVCASPATKSTPRACPSHTCGGGV